MAKRIQKLKKKVVYTCLTGRYDELFDHAYINPEWDYVCFTDDSDIRNFQNSSWQIRPLVFDKLDNVRNQRWHKLHPHLLFPEYKESLYVDANVGVMDSGLFEDVAKVGNAAMAIAKHPIRKNIFAEFEACLEAGKDDPLIICRQRELIKNMGFLGKYGTFFETNIIFRKHHDRKIKALMKEWWWWIENHSRRDQLSLTYVFWKHKFKIKPLAAETYRKGNKVRFRYGEKHVTLEELAVQKKVLVEQLVQKDEELAQKEEELVRQNKEIEMMRNSKFWQLRAGYLHIKELMRVVQIERGAKSTKSLEQVEFKIRKIQSVFR